LNSDTMEPLKEHFLEKRFLLRFRFLGQTKMMVVAVENVTQEIGRVFIEKKTSGRWWRVQKWAV